MQSTNPKWKHYEEQTFKVVKQLNPKSAVYHDVKVMGKLSKTSRQIDVQLVNPQEYDFVAFECKDYKVPIDIPRIESFAAKLKDLGTPKGAMVANSGYTKPAIKLAKEWGVDLLSLVDTEDPLIRFQLFLNGVFHGVHIKTFNAFISSSTSVPFTISQEISMMKLMNEAGTVVPAYDLFAHFWNVNDSPFSRIPGNYQYVYENPCTVRLVDLKDRIIPLDRFSFEYRVVRDSFLGKIKVINTSGLYDVHKRTYTSKSFSTEKIIPSELIEKWVRVDEERVVEIENTSQLILEAVAEMPETYPLEKM